MDRWQLLLGSIFWKHRCHKTCHESLERRINTDKTGGFKSHRRHKIGNLRKTAGSLFFLCFMRVYGLALLHVKDANLQGFLQKTCHDMPQNMPRKRGWVSAPLSTEFRTPLLPASPQTNLPASFSHPSGHPDKHGA